MDAAVTPIELQHRLAAFPPPTLIDVRQQPAFEQDPAMIADDHAMQRWGMLVYDALYAWCRETQTALQ